MNFVIFQFAGGNVFFLGAAMLASSLLLLVSFRRIVLRCFARALFIVGIAGIAFSATPLSYWIYGLLGLLAVACLLLCELAPTTPFSRWRTGALLLFFATLAGVCVAEGFHRVSPKIIVSSSRRIYVVGDSVSAGVDAGIKLWPDILGDAKKLSVVNLAKAGATAASALHQVGGIASEHSLVLLEIGGNDILGQSKAADFRKALDALLARLTAAGHDVVMFELPLPPFANAFGETQRLLARKYGIPLIPKTCLANVFAPKDATIDGVHLSQIGQNALAKAVSRMLVIEQYLRADRL